MNDEQLKQRIKYLVEHGGLLEDPLSDIRREVRAALVLAGAATVLTIIDIAVLVF